MSDIVFENVTENEEGAPEISAQELSKKLSEVEAIDVRRPDEFTGELGHIEGASLVTLETDLEAKLPNLDKSKTFVFICRSGKRSSRATLMAKDLGFENAFNMEGGMLKWGALGFPVKKA